MLVRTDPLGKIQLYPSRPVVGTGTLTSVTMHDTLRSVVEDLDSSFRSVAGSQQLEHSVATVSCKSVDENDWWQGLKQTVAQHGPAAVAAVGAGIAVWSGDV